jgi:hypothetical protein
MHRSGTSLVTRVLGLLGAKLPEHLLSANSSNAAGHWEPQRLVEVHDRMLVEAGSRWDDWRAFDPAVLGAERLAYYRNEIKRIIVEEFGDSLLFVLKDPRICRFVPLYSAILVDLGVEPLYLLPSRNPLAVIASLEKRDAITPDFASFMWLRHSLDAEAMTRGGKRFFVAYEDFLRDWRVVNEMGVALGLSWPRPVEEAAVDIERFLRPNLQHHAASRAELEASAHIEVWVRETYFAVLRLCGPHERTVTLADLTRIKREFDGPAAMFGKAVFPELAARDARHFVHGQQAFAALASALESIATRDADIVRLNNEKEVHAAQAAQSLDQARSEQNRLHDVIDAVYNSTSWRISAPLRSIRRGASVVSAAIQRLKG